jgi:putative protease
MNNSELLSPAGNSEALKYAVYNGADAVYLGLDKFNARNKAENFNEINVKSAVDFAHIFGVKVYAAFNTLIKNSEVKEFLRLIEIAADAGIDAFIVQSLSMARLIKKMYPGAALHASTQMGIHNRYGAALCRDEGFKRVILSRECGYDDIKDITQNVDIETEAFIHGAMCAGFSGGCYMSSFISCNSGNRGLCLQPCRLNYAVYEENRRFKEGSLLSMPDLCMGNDIQKLISCGVKSLKIEGRLRRAEYTGLVTRYYRNILDGKKTDISDDYALKAMFNRGNFTKGFYGGEKIGPYIEHQGHMGAYIGKVIKVDKNTIEISSNKELSEGDGFKIFKNGRECGNAVFFSRTGDRYLLKYKGNIKPGADVNVTTDLSLIKNLLSQVKKLKTDIVFQAFTGKPSSIKFIYGGTEIVSYSDYIVQETKTTATDVDDIKEKLKLNDEIFEYGEITVKCDENSFIPLSVLKKLKNEGLRKLKDKLLDNYGQKLIKNCEAKKALDEMNIKKEIRQPDRINKAVIVDNRKHLSLCENAYAYIFRPDNYTENDFKLFFGESPNEDITDKIYLYLPNLCLKEDLFLIKRLINEFNIKGIYINNPSGYYLAKEMNLKVFSGTGLNIFNDYDIAFAKGFGSDYAFSSELSYYGIKNEIYDKSGFIFIYGDIDLMTMTACPVKPIYGGDCGQCRYKGVITLKDRINENFYIKRYKLAKCYFNILNGKKLNAIKKDIKYNLLFNFAGETDNITKDIYHLNNVEGSYTNGHTYREVK